MRNFAIFCIVIITVGPLLCIMAATVQASGFNQHVSALTIRYYIKAGVVGYYFDVNNVKKAIIAVNGGTPTCAPAQVARDTSFDWNASVNAAANINLETVNPESDATALRLLAGLYRIANPMNVSTTVKYVNFGTTSGHQVSFGDHKPLSFPNSIGTNLSVDVPQQIAMQARALVAAFSAVCGAVNSETMATILLSLTKAGERQMFAETRNADLFAASGANSLVELQKSKIPKYYRFKGALVVVMEGVYDVVDRGAADSYFVSQSPPIDLRPATACPLINPDNEAMYITSGAAFQDNLLSENDFKSIVKLNRASPGVREAMCNIRSIGTGRTRTEFLTDLINAGAGAVRVFPAATTKMPWATAVKSVRVGLTYSSEDPRDLTLLIELSRLDKWPASDDNQAGENVFSFYVMPYVRTYDHGSNHAIWNTVIAAQRQHGMDWKWGTNAANSVSVVLNSTLKWGDWGALGIDDRRKSYLMWAASNLLSDKADDRKWRTEPIPVTDVSMPLTHLRPNYNVRHVPHEISLERRECTSVAENMFNDQSNMCVPKAWWADALQKRHAWTTDGTNLKGSVIIAHELKSGAAQFTGIMTTRGDCMNLLNPALIIERTVPTEYYEYMKKAMNLVSNPNVGIVLCGVEVSQEEVVRSVTNIIKVEGPSSSFGATSGVVQMTNVEEKADGGSAAGPTFDEQQLSRKDLSGIDVRQQSITEDAKSQFTQGMSQHQQQQSMLETDPFTLAVGTKAKCESDPAFAWIEERCQPKTSETQCPADPLTGFLPGPVAKYDADLRACHTQVMFGVNPDFIGAALVLAGVGAFMLGGKK